MVIWEASDRVCGNRLRPLVPMLVEAMERHGHLQLAAEVREGLLAMSAATIDRALRDVRGRSGGRMRRRAPPSAAVRRSVTVRTFEGWDDPPPSFMEADLVAHSGPTARGSFVQTLTVTDIATGWTECAPVLVREGAQVRKRYHAPATPYQRLLADMRTPDAVRRNVEAVYATLDPVRLLSVIRQAQARLVEIADRPAADATPAAGVPTLEQFLDSLRTAWQQGEVRPTSRTPERGEARSAASGPLRGGHVGGARVVRCRAMADEPRAVRAIAGDASWHVPGRLAAHAAAADQGLAP